MQMPALALGTWSAPENSEERQQVAKAVYDAISLGYRHIDTAWFYEVEDKVGEGARLAIKEGLVKREDLFIVTKIWVWNLSHDAVLRQAQESLANLQLDYIDCLLIHWPVPMKNVGKSPSEQPFPLDSNGNPLYDDSVDIHNETWPALEECFKRGWAKSIGVSNYSTQQIEDLMKVAKIKPVVNQVESTPFLAQSKLKAVCDKHNIILTAYSPLGTSGIQNKDGTWSGHPLRNALFSNEVIKSLAEKYSKSIGQILLRFHTDRGVAVIPKSTSKNRIEENMKIFDFSFDENDWDALSSINFGWRSIINVPLSESKNYPLNQLGL